MAFFSQVCCRQVSWELQRKISKGFMRKEIRSRCLVDLSDSHNASWRVTLSINRKETPAASLFSEASLVYQGPSLKLKTFFWATCWMKTQTCIQSISWGSTVEGKGMTCSVFLVFKPLLPLCNSRLLTPSSSFALQSNYKHFYSGRSKNYILTASFSQPLRSLCVDYQFKSGQV